MTGEVNKRLVSYIKKARSRGMNKQTIKQGLKSKGWKDNQIESSWREAVGLPKGTQGQNQKNQVSNFNASQNQNKKSTIHKSQTQKLNKKKASSGGKQKNQVSQKTSKDSSQKNKTNQKTQNKQSQENHDKKSSLVKKKDSKQKPGSSGLFSNPMVKMSVIGLGILVVVGVVLLLVLGSGGELSDEDLESGKVVSMDEGKDVKFTFEEQEHTARVDSVSGDEVEITIQSDPQTFSLKEGDKKLVNLNGDDYYDLIVQVESVSDGEAEVYFIKTHSKICTPDWNCSSWGECVEGSQERTCTDVNECGEDEGKPEETKSCECVSEWNCTDWSECVNGSQERTCTDEHSCGDISGKPVEVQNCTASQNASRVNQTENLTEDEQMCVNLGGKICNSSEYCDGSLHNIQGSDIVCCNASCVLNESSSDGGACSSQGGDSCNSSEYCDLDSGANLLSASDVEVCCSDECEYFNRSGLEIPDRECDTNYSEFLFSKFENSCTEGETMTCIDKTDAAVFLGIGGMFGTEKTGIIVNGTTFYEFNGKNSQGECVMESTVESLNAYLHPEYEDFLKGRGTSEEELNEMAEDSEKETRCYSGKTHIFVGNQIYGSESYLKGNNPDCDLSFYMSTMPCVVEKEGYESVFVQGSSIENIQVTSSDESIINASMGQGSSEYNYVGITLLGEDLGLSNITIIDEGVSNCKMEYRLEVVEPSY